MAKRSRYDFADAEGKPTAFPLESLDVPSELRLDGDRLWYRLSPTPRLVIPAAGLLGAFLNLTQADDVLVFARRWGVLGLCREHGWPLVHVFNYGDPTDKAVEPCPLFREIRDKRAWIGEDVNRWLQLRGQAAAMLSIARQLNNDDLGSPADWRTLNVGLDPAGTTSARLVSQREALADRINAWIQVGQVRPRVIWTSAVPTVDLWAGLFSAIAMYLLAAVTGGSSVAWCSACGKFFQPLGRAPKKGTLHYCSMCKKSGAARRFAVSASRLRSSI